MWKILEEVKLLFQQFLVLNWVKQFFSTSVFKRYNERMVCNVKMYQKTNDDKSL